MLLIAAGSRPAAGCRPYCLPVPSKQARWINLQLPTMQAMRSNCRSALFLLLLLLLFFLVSGGQPPHDEHHEATHGGNHAYHVQDLEPHRDLVDLDSHDRGRICVCNLPAEGLVKEILLFGAEARVV